jgi:hypothetical protein
MNSKNKIFLGLLGSILIVIIDNFLFDKTVEFLEYGSEIGDILTNLSLAYISSYIFYRIVVVEREKEIKKNIYKSVNNTTKKMIFDGYYILDTLAENEKNDRNLIHTKRHKITEDEYNKLCEKINPNSLSRFSNQVGEGELKLKSLTKIETIHLKCVEMMKKHIQKVMLFLPYLDDEHITVINKIIDSTLLSTDRHLFFARTNTNFKIYQKMMYDYLLIIRQLEVLYDRQKSIT